MAVISETGTGDKIRHQVKYTPPDQAAAVWGFIFHIFTGRSGVSSKERLYVAASAGYAYHMLCYLFVVSLVGRPRGEGELGASFLFCFLPYFHIG